MARQSSLVFHTSVAEVAIVGVITNNGAAAKNINHQIPCQNMAGDFCFNKISYAFAEKGKTAKFGLETKLFSPTSVKLIIHVFGVSPTLVKPIIHVSGVSGCFQRVVKE